MPTFADKEKFEGHTYRIDVGSGGTWSAHFETFEHDRIQAATLDELRIKIRARVRRQNAKLEMKATLVGLAENGSEDRWHSDRFDPKSWPTKTQNVIIRGLDERRRAVMYDVDGGAAKQRRSTGSTHRSGGGLLAEIGLMSIHTAGIFTRRLTAEERDRYTALVTAREQADVDLEIFIRDVQISNVQDFIEAALEAAAKAPEEEPTGDPRVDAPAKRSKTRRTR